MTRTAWILLMLLVGSNLLWYVSRDQEPDPAASPPGTSGPGDLRALSAEDRARILAELQFLDRELAPSAEAPVLEVPEPRTAAGAEPAARARDEGPADDDAAAREARRAHQAAVLEQIKATLRKVMQVEDPALRREGLAELADGLRSTDPMLVEYSLSALHSLRVEGVDRGVFRERVLDLLTSEHGGVRRAALYALQATGSRPGDARHALAGVQDESPIVRQHVARVLKLYNGGAFTGEAEDALVALLADETRDVRRGTLRALDGATLGEPAETALIALAEQPEDRLEAVQHGLSRLKAKSRRVIDALFEHLSGDEGRVRLAAHRGLQDGIPPAQQPYVARRYADHLTKFVNPTSHQQALSLIAKFGDASLVPQVERFAENELVDTRVRAMAAKVAEHLRGK